MTPTLGYYITLWLREKASLKSYDNFCSIIKCYLTPYEALLVTELNAPFFREFIASLKLSPKRIRNILSVYRGVLQLALEDEVLTKNPLDSVRLPKLSRFEIRVFTKEETKTLLENATGWFRAFLATGFYTGARIGEIIGLQWEDIDLERRVIYVRRSISCFRIDTPKTQGSVRVIPLLDVLVPYLLELPKDSLWLFHDEEGNHLGDSKKVGGKRWRELLALTEIPYRRLYEMRHTFATHTLISGKFSAMEVAQILGHTTPQMVLQTYSRYIEGEQLKIPRGFDPFSDTPKEEYRRE